MGRVRLPRRRPLPLAYQRLQGGEAAAWAWGGDGVQAAWRLRRLQRRVGVCLAGAGRGAGAWRLRAATRLRFVIPPLRLLCRCRRLRGRRLGCGARPKWKRSQGVGLGGKEVKEGGVRRARRARRRGRERLGLKMTRRYVCALCAACAGALFVLRLRVCVRANAACAPVLAL